MFTCIIVCDFAQPTVMLSKHQASILYQTKQGVDEGEERKEAYRWREDGQRTEYCLLLICKNNSAAAWWRSKLGQRIPTEREREGEMKRYHISSVGGISVKQKSVSLFTLGCQGSLCTSIYPPKHPSGSLSSTRLYVTPVLRLYFLCLVPFHSLLINTALILITLEPLEHCAAQFLSRN